MFMLADKDKNMLIALVYAWMVKCNMDPPVCIIVFLPKSLFQHLRKPLLKMSRVRYVEDLELAMISTT